MCEIKADEYKFLRQEHENNRKYVFERPIIIIGATFASAIAVKNNSLLLLLPVPFLCLLYFNIWFTHNRMNSSSRIVAYIQLFHESNSQYKWIGWENAVRLYRKWIYNIEKGDETIPTCDTNQFDSMAFYTPIFFLHLITGVFTTVILIISSNSFKNIFKGIEISTSELIIIFSNAIVLTLFMLLFISFRPKTIRNQIEFKRAVWKYIFDKEFNNKDTSGKIDNTLHE